MPLELSSPPTADAIHRLVVEVLQSHSASELELDAVAPDTALIDGGLGLDSVDLLMSILEIEEAVKLRLREEDLTEEVFATVGGLANHVCRRLKVTVGGDGPESS